MLRRDALALSQSRVPASSSAAAHRRSAGGCASAIDIGSLLHQLTDYTLRPTKLGRPRVAAGKSLYGRRRSHDPADDFDAETDA